jgi:serine protease Do
MKAKKNKAIIFGFAVLIISSALARSSFAQKTDLRRTPVVEAVKKVAPAVVNISTEKVVKRRINPFFDNYGFFFGDFFQKFPSSRTYKRQSLGSGVLIDPKGYIITNEHVILPASKIKVALVDGREFEGKLIGSDSKFDLAVIKIEAESDFPAIKIGKSIDLMIGETVISIGNPFGLSHSVTTGVISALNRTIVTDEKRVYSDFIQTDASINPGNSGGPLLNILGELIGINTAIYQKAEGIGFAIPIDKARRIVDDLIQSGYVHRAWLGIGVQEITKQLASYFRLPQKEGVIINRVMKRSPAETAQLQLGDIITKIDEKAIKNRRDYEATISSLIAGDEIRFTLLRDSKSKTVNVRAGELPADFIWEWLGINIQEIKSELVEKFQLEVNRGVVITDILKQSPAQKTGLKPGDIIWQINDKIIENKNDFKIAIHTATQRERESILLRIIRGPYWYYAIVEP